MDEATIWWVLGGLLVAVELATGSFYLLMLALGAAAGAVAAMLGAAVSVQLAVAAVVGGAFAGGWYLKRRREATQGPGSAPVDDPIQAMDVGQLVTVTLWAADGSTRVNHRGSPWTARLHHPMPEGDIAATGTYRICHMDGNTLFIEKV
ncbi:MAG TPA: NfeD family protein [Aquabacterium sp.]|nr:NfeD family protein [Aquabacterium sp.]HRH28967.1 NfeD family protein [Aquabacterium sp.]